RSARARGVRRRLLSRQPGQVLGGRPGRRRVGSLRPQSRPRGRVTGTEGVTGAAQPAHGQGDHVLRAGDMTTATTTIPIEIVSWVTQFVGREGSGRRVFDELLGEGAAVGPLLRRMPRGFPDL